MPKENTHIFIAERATGKIGDKEIASIISNHRGEYYLGSFFPDMFLYSSRYVYIARRLHGSRMEKTSELVFRTLDTPKKGPTGRDLAFVFGYLSHCASDIVFHPAVFYLSGNYNEDDARNIGAVRYRHNRIETYIDSTLGHGFHACSLVSASLLNGLGAISALAGMFESHEGQMKRITTVCLRRELLVNRLSGSRIAYYLVKLLTRLKILSRKGELGIFYPDVGNEKVIPDRIAYRHPVTGREGSDTIQGLVDRSVELTARYIIAAYDYHTGRMTREECEKIITGASLETGMAGEGVNEMRYFS